LRALLLDALARSDLTGPPMRVPELRTPSLWEGYMIEIRGLTKHYDATVAGPM
jgi:hypothetical protein